MKYAHYLVIAFAFIIMQSAPFPWFPAAWTRPDMGFILVIHCSLLWGREKGLFFGAAMGLVRDLLLGGPVGQGILSWGLTGFFSGALRENYISGEMGVKLALAAAATAADAAVLAIMTRMIIEAEVWPAAISAVKGQMLSNLLFAAAAFPLLSLMDGFVARKSALREKKRRMKSFVSGMGATER